MLTFWILGIFMDQNGWPNVVMVYWQCDTWKQKSATKLQYVKFFKIAISGSLGSTRNPPYGTCWQFRPCTFVHVKKHAGFISLLWGAWASKPNRSQNCWLNLPSTKHMGNSYQSIAAKNTRITTPKKKIYENLHQKTTPSQNPLERVLLVQIQVGICH